MQKLLACLLFAGNSERKIKMKTHATHNNCSRAVNSFYMPCYCSYAIRPMKQLITAMLLATTAFADPIHDAAKTGDLAGVKAELDKGVDANEVDQGFYNLTPLHWAFSKGVAELLISEGADVNAITLEGSTPLHFAAWNGRKEIAELLIDNGANLNVINNELAGTPFITALDWAIQQGKTETADLLLKHGGKTSKELNALIDAAKNGDIEVVNQHLAAGADVNMEAGDGTTPLHNAAIYGHKEVGEILIANGADVNMETGDGITPLHNAAIYGHKEVGEILIANGADVNAKDRGGETPLDEAIRNKHTETADLLREHGGKTGEELNVLLDAAKKGDIEAVKQHLAAGADVNAKTADGTTPLHNAAVYGHNEVAELLIANGAEVNAIIVSGRNQGKTPVDLAIWRKKPKPPTFSANTAARRLKNWHLCRLAWCSMVALHSALMRRRERATRCRIHLIC